MFELGAGAGAVAGACSSLLSLLRASALRLITYKVVALSDYLAV